MSSFLDKIKDQEKNIRNVIDEKLKRNDAVLTDYEMAHCPLNDEDVELMSIFGKILDGEEVPGFEMRDFLASPQAKILIPRVVIGQMRKSADPTYLASSFFKKIRLKAGQATLSPSIGVMRAYDVAEGMEIPQEDIDWQTHRNGLISVGKVGLRLQFTDEVIKDTDWDIVSIMLQEAGRAMARHKEQKAFMEWIKHGWIVFDNNLRKSDPIKWKEAGTSGTDFTNNLNDTMSIDDFLDLIIAVYNNEYTPTDLIMHSLAWMSFAKNGLTGVFTALSDGFRRPESPNAQFKIGPDSIQGRLPFSFNVNLSPFAPIDKINKTFDMFVVDRNNVGVQIVKDDITTEEFRDPARDLRNVKFIERYGYGTFNEGRACCAARAISMARGYNKPERIYELNK